MIICLDLTIFNDPNYNPFAVASAALQITGRIRLRHVIQAITLGVIIDLRKLDPKCESIR